MNALSETSKITVSLVSMFFAGVVGFTFWITQVYSQGVANADSISEISQVLKEMNRNYISTNLENQRYISEKLNDIDKRLTRIEVSIK